MLMPFWKDLFKADRLGL